MSDSENYFPLEVNGATRTRNLDLIDEREFSDAFVLGMRQRMRVSYFKYGALAKAYPKKLDAIKSLHVRLKKYEETGNTEYLIDAANFAMIEFMHPKHPEAHFTAEDSHASPGRVFSDGSVSTKTNEGKAA